MKKTWIVIGAIVAVLVIVGIVLVSGYNRLVVINEKVEGDWAIVETQYQRRADVIPSLVNVVKGVANFEQETLTAVIDARSRATAITLETNELTPETIAQYEAAQQEVGSALGRLLAVAESYPQLTATQAFRDLQVQVEGTENRIATARRDYNLSVQTYNTTIKSFPNSLYAAVFGFDEKGYFQSAAGTENAPTIDFGTDNQ